MVKQKNRQFLKMKIFLSYDIHDIDKYINGVKNEIDHIYDILEKMEDSDDIVDMKIAKNIKEKLKNIKRETINLNP